MNLGDQIINEIIKQGMISVAHPKTDGDVVFLWSANAPEQLEAVVANHRPPQCHAPEDKQWLIQCADQVRAQIPAGHGFMLFVCPTTEADPVEGRLRYISTIYREDAVKVLKEWLIKAGGSEEWMKHIK